VVDDCYVDTFFSNMKDSLLMLIDAVRTSLDKLLVLTISNALGLFTADIAGTVEYDFYIKVRMAWRMLNPGVKFCIDNEKHTDILKDLYLMNGEDWRTDNILNPKSDDCGCPSKK